MSKFKTATEYLTAYLVTSLKLGQKGATAVEYAIMLAAIAALIVAVVVSMGAKTDTAYGTLDTELDQLPAGG